MQGRRPKASRRDGSGIPLAIAHAFAALAILAGWWQRDEHYLLPDEGLGYAFGILGLSLMTLMLAYSLRKRLRLLQGAGRLSTWFQAHMILGLAGPVAILHHCNFHLGSFNSNLALLSTLLVAGSGVVGRFVYVRIHHGLSGRRATLAELRGRIRETRVLLPGAQSSQDLAQLLSDFEARVLRADHGFGAELAAYLLLGARCRHAARGARRRLASGDREARTALGAYLRAVRRVASFAFYERVFALWHAVHLPLCFLLFGTAAIHVFAVNLY